MEPIHPLDIDYLRNLNPTSEAVLIMANTVNQLIKVANAGLVGAKVEHHEPEAPSQPIAGETPTPTPQPA